MADSYIGHVNNVESIKTFRWEKGSSPQNPVMHPITADWSQVRYTGFALLVVDSISNGGTPTLSVKSVMEDGFTEIDEFSIVRT